MSVSPQAETVTQQLSVLFQLHQPQSLWVALTQTAVLQKGQCSQQVMT